MVIKASEMNNKIMISHSSKDQSRADILSNLLKKCSLNQVSPWFSSDPSQGGIGAGQRWFDKIRSEIIKSKAIIVLLTENSIESSWVQFEAGFGAGVAELELIPLVMGLKDLTRVPNPISHWQVFDATNLESTTVFVRKFLDAFNIHFDDELVRIAIVKLLQDVSNLPLVRESANDTKSHEIDPELRRYLDQKFFDISAGFSGYQSNFASYLVKFHSTFNSNLEVRIDLDTTMQDVTNELYFQMDKIVKPYKYLESWIIFDVKWAKYIVIREIQDLVLARLIFTPQG